MPRRQIARNLTPRESQEQASFFAWVDQMAQLVPQLHCVAAALNGAGLTAMAAARHPANR